MEGAATATPTASPRCRAWGAEASAPRTALVGCALSPAAHASYHPGHFHPPYEAKGLVRIGRIVGSLGLAAVVAPASARPALAVLDIEDRGPALDVGAFSLRITNIGVLGNAYYNRGLSNDASWEFPRGSGHEALEHAELWVGGRRSDGKQVVSGGPMLEFRPSLAPEDRVRIGMAGGPGTRPVFDDDGDGRIDEEPLDGLDNDGDGEVDEDVFIPSQQLAETAFTDDRAEAVSYGYPNGVRHVPLGLSVRPQASAWSSDGTQ